MDNNEQSAVKGSVAAQDARQKEYEQGYIIGVIRPTSRAGHMRPPAPYDNVHDQRRNAATLWKNVFVTPVEITDGSQDRWKGYQRRRSDHGPCGG